MPTWALKLLFAVVNLPPLAGVLVWPFVALMSFMSFDAPGSGASPLTWLLVVTVWFYPIPTIFGARETYKNCKNRKFGKCVVTSFITYSGVLAIAFASITLQLFCGGKLAC